MRKTKNEWDKGVKLWDKERPELGKKNPRDDGCEDLAEDFMPLLQTLGMGSTILLFPKQDVKTDVESFPHPSVTALFQEGQLNSPVHHSSSSGADICKVDLRLSF